MLVLHETDIAPPERNERSRAALARFRIVEVTGPGAEFDASYAALWEEFGERGELEKREVLLRELEGRPRPDGLLFRYHLLNFYDGELLAAVRDVFSVCWPDRKFCYVLLSHSLVLPPWRRSGLAALVRAAPAAAGRRVVQEAGLNEEETEIILMAEMDPVNPAVDATVVRLLAYGTNGYRIVPPQWFPYIQPDFSGWVQAGRDPKPVPLLVVFRRLGKEHLETLPRQLAHWMLDAIDEVHRPDSPEDVEVRRRLVLEVLGERDPLPTILVDRRALHRLEPVLRAHALPLFPVRHGGTSGEAVGDAQTQLQELLSKWSIS